MFMSLKVVEYERKLSIEVSSMKWIHVNGSISWTFWCTQWSCESVETVAMIGETSRANYPVIHFLPDESKEMKQINCRKYEPKLVTSK